MRIAAIVATDAASGPGRQLAALAQRLREQGADFLTILLHRPGGLAPPDAPRLTDVDTEVVPDRGPLDVRLPAAVAAILRAWQPTVVQTHGYKATAVAYTLRRRGARWSWVGCFHGATHENLKVRLYHRLDRWMLRRADRIVVMSQDQAAPFAQCQGRVRVIRNAMIPIASSPVPPGGDGEEEQRLAGLRRALAPPVMGVVGRLSPEKGVDIFLDACALLARRGTAFSAVVAGDGQERQRLERQRERLGLTARVHFIGHVRAIEKVYDSLDILVIPSRSEGLPNALLEAVSAGVSVVGTRVGAIPDVLEGLDSSALVDPGSSDALAAAMERTLESRPADGRRRRQPLVDDRFSLERRVAAHVTLYEELTR